MRSASSAADAAQAMAQHSGRSEVRTWPALALLTAGLAAAFVLLASGEAKAAPETVYSNDFAAAAVGPEWSNQNLETSPSGQRFLGRLANEDSATLSLPGLPAHDRLVVEFDIYIMDSMDGNDTGPESGEEEDGVAHPDVFGFSADGILVKQTTFGNRHPQAFPGDYPGASNPPKTGATALDSLGYDEDTTFRLSLSFPHSGNALAFTAAGHGLEDLNDESWGLDNISVSADRTAQPIAATTDPAAYQKCAKKARRAYRKSLRKAKKLIEGDAKRRLEKRAAKKLKAQLKRCRARFL